MMELQSLGLGGSRVFAVACACRVQIVVGHFGQTETKVECDRILDELWALVAAGDDNRAASERLRRRLENLPEASIDDPYRRGYYAMRALGVVADAISAVGEETLDGAQSAASAASDGAVSLAADIAFEAGQVDRTPRLSDIEERAEAEMVRMLDAAPEHPVDDIRRSCRKDGWPIELLEEIDRRRGWVRVAPL
jgi:hypothetical protein